MVTIDIFRHAEDTTSYLAGEAIFSKGEPGDKAYVVKEGEVEIEVPGREPIVLGAGGIFGEMALIDREPRSAGARARSDAKLVVLDERRFLFLVQQTPNFALLLMRVMAERLRTELRRV